MGADRVKMRRGMTESNVNENRRNFNFLWRNKKLIYENFNMLRFPNACLTMQEEQSRSLRQKKLKQ